MTSLGSGFLLRISFNHYQTIFCSKKNNQSSNMTLVLFQTVIMLTALIQIIFVTIIISEKTYWRILAPEVFFGYPLIIILKWQLNVTESSLLSSKKLQFQSFTIFIEKNEMVGLAILCFVGYFQIKQRFETIIDIRPGQIKCRVLTKSRIQVPIWFRVFQNPE